MIGGQRLFVVAGPDYWETHARLMRETPLAPFGQTHSPSRAADFVRRRAAGETLQSIANAYGLSRERVRQVLNGTR